ncbi:cytochrome c-type biogenesis protein [Diaphorobacter aerolatus]|uniref:Cytochrome c-type biogenesis protein n=1 Tax=Diaphorobacter aerolatus TaxID=1288495 RepID=A0A7H0GKH1_9BURK|nr:cytochrome c-type biogenesis protein [Diaphorobacter aerolatus]QNP48787.1 cytochrome c-type biogenesis protein CcmH [Diaphorobacter aerolatus]
MNTRIPFVTHLAGLLLTISIATLFTANSARAQSLEEREAALASQLRCVVCQNQTVAESRAPIAQDMRQQIRVQLEQGHTDEQIVAFFEQRYGTFVRYNPPWKASTWLLWLSPFFIALGGLWLLRRNLPKARKQTTLSPQERERAERWLESGKQEPRS